jgi:hypothetical protein
MISYQTSNDGCSSLRPTLADHRRWVEQVRALAEALPAGDVRAPDMPVSRFVEEGFGMLIGCRAHFPSLAEVGVSAVQVESFRELVFGLQAAQALLDATRLIAGPDCAPGPIERATRLRDRVFTLAAVAAADLRNCAEFAFRRDRTDERRALFRSAYRRRHAAGFRTLRDSDEFDVWRKR